MSTGVDARNSANPAMMPLLRPRREHFRRIVPWTKRCRIPQILPAEADIGEFAVIHGSELAQRLTRGEDAQRPNGEAQKSGPLRRGDRLREFSDVKHGVTFPAATMAESPSTG
jgi:hypothetical protein